MADADRPQQVNLSPTGSYDAGHARWNSENIATSSAG